MKRLLLIEDNGDSSYDIKSELTNCGYEIKQADSYLSAYGMWCRYKGEFDGIILDLNISPEGLSEKECSSYFPFSSLPFMLKIGWNTTFDKNIKVVVYSGYIDEFKKLCKKKDISYSDMIFFYKGGTNFCKLIEYVKSNI